MNELTPEEKETIGKLIDYKIHEIKHYYGIQFKLAYNTNLTGKLKEHYDLANSEIKYLEGIKKKL